MTIDYTSFLCPMNLDDCDPENCNPKNFDIPGCYFKDKWKEQLLDKVGDMWELGG